jgi:NADH:ubiquinone oxidoreductase subunit 5 (subunit L)/multisubunit Na+/H+ antiporter MnhA subunit
MNYDAMIHWLGLATLAFPAMLLAMMGIASIASARVSESVVARFTQTAVASCLVCAVGVLLLMILSGKQFVSIDAGDWVAIEQEHFHFHIRFIFDRLSMPFLLLSLVLCGIVASFTQRYLHREPGFFRFFLLYSIFLNGMVLSAVAGTIETLFFGWEMVGLSSALLVAYFQEREIPARNGQRVWSVYRLADAAFLIAALSMHHLTGQGDFAAFVGNQPWPGGRTELSPENALAVGLLLLLAASGKSALVPFSGWLARAMEGPTPSTAVFYGSLSVHLGAYLLLRVSPILEASWTLRIIIIAVGAISSISGSLISKVQSDVKTALAYASLSQVGMIVVEIGLGFYYLALIHIIGHACLRTMQLLRAPTLMSDYHAIENAIGSRVVLGTKPPGRILPESVKRWIYRFGFERGFMDAALDRFIIHPFLVAFEWADLQERRWTDWLSRAASRESDRTDLHPEQVDAPKLGSAPYPIASQDSEQRGIA